jgi:hypothetical protein
LKFVRVVFSLFSSTSNVTGLVHESVAKIRDTKLF